MFYKRKRKTAVKVSVDRALYDFVTSRFTFELYKDKFSRTQYKLVHAAGTHKKAYVFSWNGEGFTRGRDIAVMQEHQPHCAKWLFEYLTLNCPKETKPRAAILIRATGARPPPKRKDLTGTTLIGSRDGFSLWLQPSPFVEDAAWRNVVITTDVGEAWALGSNGERLSVNKDREALAAKHPEIHDWAKSVIVPVVRFLIDRQVNRKDYPNYE